MQFLSKAAVAACLLQLTSAHPGHDATAEIREREAYMSQLETRDLSHCATVMAERGLSQQIQERRERFVAAERKKRGLENGQLLRARDFGTVLATNHHSNLSITDPAAAQSIIFGTVKDAILSPETTEGPYYVSGELVRKDITDGQAGVETIVDIQLINYKTCEPLTGVALDFWHCNATGVYGGIVAQGNGNANDQSNINNTMLRGIQISDSNGVVTFKTIFPGHYTGRTNHIHVLSHVNATLLANNTVTGGKASHVGQMFFDQSLVDQVSKVKPYSSNTQSHMTNAADGIMSGASATDDPVLEYVFLGSSVSQGIFGWINIGIDPTSSRSVSAAATWSDKGGYKNAGSSMGGGPGGAGGPGGMGGAPPGARSSSSSSRPRTSTTRAGSSSTRPGSSTRTN